jgi:KaiC/GvpD/RAD55 family RecA-like ATPase
MTTELLAAIGEAGGRRQLVSALVLGSQRLWDSWVDRQSMDCWTGAFSVRSIDALAQTAFPSSATNRKLFTSVLTPLVSDDPGEQLVYGSLLEPDSLVAHLVPLPLLREDDRRFFVCAAIRDENCCRWSPELRRTFHHLAAAMVSSTDRAFEYRSLRQTLLDNGIEGVSVSNHRQYVAAYLQVVRHLRIVVPAKHERGSVRVAPDDIDPEFIIASLFGVSTGIAGLDQLFGGSGPILPEHQAPVSSGNGSRTELMESVCLPGRLILIRGAFGSGKSLLACHLAASVARKGGIANITSVEQEPTEYLYMLTSMGLIPSQPGFDIEFEFEDPAKGVARPSMPKGGALVYTRAKREQFEGGFMAMVALASQMTSYPLRLLVIDSLNGLADDSERQPERKALHKAFRALAAMGVNTIIIEEENESGATLTSEDENLADTVIRLSVATESRYWKRRIQIKKCRFQREQRGEHHFSIASDKGINVVPSTAAVRTRVAQRRARSMDGVPASDACLLNSVVGLAPRLGHVVVIEGKAGTMKSSLVDAVLGTSGSDSAAKLFVGEPRRSNAHVEPSGPLLKFVPRGFSSPGVMFQLLDEIFFAWRRRSTSSTAKLAIDDIAGLDLDSPLAASDSSIGHVLVDYLRRQDALSIIASRSPEHGEDEGIRRAVVADADYHLQLVRISPGNDGRVLLNVVKSPEMRHRRGWFDVIRNGAGVRLSDVPALVNVQDGEVRPLKVMLFMFADAARQSKYNASVVAHLRSHPNLDVQLASQDAISGANAFHLEGRSGHADVRIIQLDEFQLPDSGARTAELFRFPMDTGSDRPVFLRHLLARTSTGEGLRLAHALPYYCNIGFLVCRRGLAQLAMTLGKLCRDQASGTLLKRLAESDAQASQSLDWSSLAAACDVFEEHRKETEVQALLRELHFSDAEREHACLFEHTGWMDENSAVLYLEILLWLRSRTAAGAKAAQHEKLERWVLSDEGIEAALIFRRLCRPGHLRNGSGRVAPRVLADRSAPEQTQTARTPCTGALVWRHWFTTLGELADALPPEAVSGTTVRVLPGAAKPGDCSVAGEWYLGVLADSALPEAGLALINNLVTPEAELERLRRGIGLPTQRYFYGNASENEGVPAETWSRSRQLNFTVSRPALRDVLENAFRRSQFDGYVRRAPSLSFALWSVLDFEAVTGRSDPERWVRERIREILQEHVQRVAYMERGPGDESKRESVVPPP